MNNSERREPEFSYTFDAPTLLVPNLFDTAYCRRLIGLWGETVGRSGVWVEGQEEAESGVGKPVRLRHDCDVWDPIWVKEIESRIGVQLRQAMLDVFNYDPAFHESIRIGCYDAQWFERFKPHRDDEGGGNAYRKFTLIVNLNSEGYEGGELCFPEYAKMFKPSSGTGLVFPCSAIHEVTSLVGGRRFILMTRFMDQADYYDWVNRSRDPMGSRP